MTKRTKAILTLAVALTVACASVSAGESNQPRAIDLPYVDDSNGFYEDYSSPPIWTNTKDNDEHDREYCGPGYGRSISRCPGLGRGGHTFPGDIAGAPGAGPGDWGHGRFHRRHLRRRDGRAGDRHRPVVSPKKKREISIEDSDLHLDDVHLTKRGIIDWSSSDLHLDDVKVDFEKRQETFYDPEKDPEPDVFENDVKIYKRAEGSVEAGVAAEARSGVKVKRAIVLYDKDASLEENADLFGEVLPVDAQTLKKKRQETYYDPENDPEPDVFENDVKIYKRQEEKVDFDDGIFDMVEEDDSLVDDDDEDEDEERRLDDLAGVQDWIEEMRLEELQNLEGHPDGLHLDDEDSQDGQTPSEEEIFAAHWENA
ncbi:hypothetical protein BGW41_002234 [Actinomortierella wolfii]|nr:hypothetical protein BGW41_002234 [Actinomortierella wolfii]